MPNRLTKTDRESKIYAVNANTLIERLRKTRALSCNPSDVGMDGYMDWLNRYGKAYFLFGKTWGISVNRPILALLSLLASVYSSSQNVKNMAQIFFSHGNLDWCPCIYYLKSSLNSIQGI